MKMLFKELYLFSPTDESARKVEFQPGINIITSSQEDGTNRGKSVIMRSLYHTLGAEAHFENKWEGKNKVYILHFSIEESDYYIYRAANLYKVFDSDKNLLFITTKSRELSEQLKTITGFAVMLPNRQSDRLEITPPVYNYLPYFLDQDHYDGSTFSSFSNLGQYQNYKDHVLFYHFGIYGESYFALIRQKEEMEDEINQLENRFDVLRAVLLDIDQKLETGAYAGSIDALKRTVDQYKNEYADIMQKLNACKVKLIDLRNSLYDLRVALQNTEEFSRKNERAIKKLESHTCPECGTTLEDTLSLRSKHYNISEDSIIVKNDLQVSIQTIISDIEREEARYRELLVQLRDYERKLKLNTAKVNDVLRHRGLCELRDDVVKEQHEIQDKLTDKESLLKKVKSTIKGYTERKEKILERYYELLLRAKLEFGLDEINAEKFKNISSVFSASGSDRNIATVIWYFAIIKLRSEFNPEAIQFPIVLDSPNNVETDNEKERAFIQYLLDNSSISSQFIMSGIGFDSGNLRELLPQNVNVINLTNKKYHLLSENEYALYSPLMKQLCDAE